MFLAKMLLQLESVAQGKKPFCEETEQEQESPFTSNNDIVYDDNKFNEASMILVYGVEYTNNVLYQDSIHVFKTVSYTERDEDV